MPRQSYKRAATIALIGIASLSLLGLGCRRPESVGGDNLNTELVVWGLWQDSAQMQPLVDAFEEQFGVTVTYRKHAGIATYEQDLLQALAEGRGPDVFVIHHTWPESRRGIMSPAPTDIIDTRALNEEFVEVVGEDVVRDGSIWALPTSVDTLAMYYNRDLFNAAGISTPPATWTDFQSVVERLTRVSRTGTIQQSGAAIGTASNVNRAGDIVQLLLLQSGLAILDQDDNTVDLANDTAERALTFYTDFANKAKRVYTWNPQADFSIDAFAESETAIMFNYSYHLPTVRAKNPRLNFAIAPVPQIAGSSTESFRTFAAYWPFAVSNSSRNSRTAWTFIRFMTNTNAAQTLNQAQRVPPARRDSVPLFNRDPDLGVFAEQSLTARSWPRSDQSAADQIFNTMIDSVVQGAATIPDALKRAEDQLNELSRQQQ